MNIKYFQDTDTLYIEFKAAEVAESKDLDEDTVLDLDQSGNICGITVEHAEEDVDARLLETSMIMSGGNDEHLRRDN